MPPALALTSMSMLGEWAPCRGLVAAAREYVGEIDIYCSNAGVAAGTGEDSTEEMWHRSWDVNVMADVRASRELIPGWAAQGYGRFVVTASAARLLTVLGTAPYSVTKHAAVGYAEWLAATYAEAAALYISYQTGWFALHRRAGGAIKPLVSERLGLADVIDGLERLAAGTTIGRVTFLP